MRPNIIEESLGTKIMSLEYMKEVEEDYFKKAEKILNDKELIKGLAYYLWTLAKTEDNEEIKQEQIATQTMLENIGMSDEAKKFDNLIENIRGGVFNLAVLTTINYLIRGE